MLPEPCNMMELKSFNLEPTPKTPQVDFNQITGELILSGRSIPENAAKLYEPILDWIKKYIVQARPITNLALKNTQNP
jgi:hypothetical protein